MSARFRRNATNLIPILKFLLFDASHLSAATSSWIVTTLLMRRNFEDQLAGILYSTGRVLCVATNSFECLHSSKECGMDTWSRLRRATPNRTWKTSYPTNYLSPLPHSTWDEGIREAGNKGNTGHGRFRPCANGMASTIVIGIKKDGTLRFCVDYCKLNAVKTWESYRIPAMDECINLLGDATIL